MAREAGKGSGRRPSGVPDEVVADNWALAFGKKDQPAQPQSQRGEFNGTMKIIEEVFDPHLTINS